MKSGTRFFRPYDLPLTALAFALVVLYTAVAGAGFPLDDSWIHQGYGRNLGLSGEWAFLPGVPSAASTSPLYTVVLGLGYALRVDIYLWTHGMGALALAGAGMIAARLGDRIPTGWKHTGTLTGVATVTTWHLVWAAASGMETMLFALFTLILMALGWREAEQTATAMRSSAIRGLWFGLAAALTVALRPEGALLAGLVGLAVLVAHGPDRWRIAAVWTCGALVGFAVGITPYLLLNLHLTGGLLPNTSAAKQASMAEYVSRHSFFYHFLRIFGSVIIGTQMLLLFGVAFYAARIHRRVPARHVLLALVPLVWALGLISLYAARLPLFSQHGRYIMPALPALIVTGMPGTVLLVRAMMQKRVTRVLALALGASGLLLGLMFTFVMGPLILREDVDTINREMVAAALWIDENLPPEDGLLALHDIGAVGYFTPRPLLDIAGLITPEAIPLIGDSEAIWALMKARGAAYALFLPDQVPGLRVDDPRLCRIYSRPDAPPDGWIMTLYRISWDETCADS